MAGRIGVVKVEMDGRWDIENLLDFADSIRDSYSFFYVVAHAGSENTEYLERIVADHFWRGDIPSHRLRERLYSAVPDDEGLKIRSIRYSSPGFMELAGLLGALLLAGKVVNTWLDASSKMVKIYGDVNKFFEDRKHLRRPRGAIEVGPKTAIDVDEARRLMFEMGDAMGYSAAECERILGMVNNPIAGLKFMVALANETRKLAVLSEKGLLSFPEQKQLKEIEVDDK